MEAEDGRGLRRTGEGPFTCRVFAWKAEKDWTGILAGMDGFKRGEGSRGSEEEEEEASDLIFREMGRSIVSHGSRWSDSSLENVAIVDMHRAVSDIVPSIRK